MAKFVKVIGITGPLGAGKSTAGEIIESICGKYGIPCRLMPMAEALKVEAFMSGWDGLKNAKGRKLLQDLGQAQRDDDADYWINIWKAKYMWYSGMRPEGVALVDDVRYNNEAKLIRDLGGKVIKIDKRKGVNNGHKNHPSEQGVGISYLNHVVNNVRDFKNLRTQLEFLATRYFGWSDRRSTDD